MNTVVLHLGSNLGDRRRMLNLALRQITNRIGVINSRSRIFETGAWGKTDQTDFLNMAVEVHASKDAETILRDISIIEKKMGRLRVEKWGPRTIDIDIIFFNSDIIEKPHLKIPHPELTNRNFVLAPLLDICPTYLHPQLKKTVAQLDEDCQDTGKVVPIEMQA